MATGTPSANGSAKGPGFFSVPNNLVLRHGRTLTPVGVAVYCAIAVHVDKDSRQGHPSYQTIAGHLGVCKRTVMRAVGQLMKLGVLTKTEKRLPDGRLSANLYTLPLSGMMTRESLFGDTQDTTPVTPESPPRCLPGHHPSDSRAPGTILIEQTSLNQTQRTTIPPTSQGATGEVNGTARKSSRKAQRADAPGFDEFWAAYPRKVSKQDVRRAWDKLAPDEAQRTVIMGALELHKLCEQWSRDGGRYIPDPATWLNNKRWEDQIDDRQANGSTTD